MTRSNVGVVEVGVHQTRHRIQRRFPVEWQDSPGVSLGASAVQSAVKAWLVMLVLGAAGATGFSYLWSLALVELITFGLIGMTDVKQKRR